jgi:Delta3-Delta2-enoyl-CoA isomerase
MRRSLCISLVGRHCSTASSVPSQPHDTGVDNRSPPRWGQVEAPPTEEAKRTSVVTVTESPLANVHVLSLNSPPVNTLTSDVIRDLLGELRRLADPESGCRGIVLTSDLPTTFSSGLDLNVFSREPFDQAIFAHYWAQFQELFMTMHAFPLPLVAAINGHAPAAGCIMACACDYRVMAEGPTPVVSSENPSKPSRPFMIGITAARAGFAAPPFVARNLSWIVGSRVAQDMLTRGSTLTAVEAHRIGLVDEVVGDGGEAVVAALHEIERYLELPMEHTRWLVKDHMRRPIMALLQDKNLRAEDCVYFADMIQSPDVRRDLQNYAQSLSKKKSS